MNRIARLTVLVLLMALLAGCTTRLAYNNLDWLAVRWIDRQVELDRDQRELVSDHVAEQQRWHCTTQLGEYQVWLEQIRLDLLSGRIERAQLVDYGDQMAVFARSLAGRIEPLLVDLAASLDDAQVEAILQELDERIEKLREEIASRTPEQWASERVEGMERRLRRLMGPVNPRQRERLEQWASDLMPTHDHQLRQRLYWRDRIAKALDRRSDRSVLDAEISALLDPSAAWPVAYRRAIETNRELTLDALVDMVRLVEPRQRSRISARISRLQKDFERLSCEGDAAPDLLAAVASD